MWIPVVCDVESHESQFHNLLEVSCAINQTNYAVFPFGFFKYWYQVIPFKLEHFSEQTN